MRLLFENYNKINKEEELPQNERILKPLALEEDKIFAYITENLYTGEIVLKSSKNYEKYIKDEETRKDIRRILADFQYLLKVNELEIDYDDLGENIFQYNNGNTEDITSNAFGLLIMNIDDYGKYNNYINGFQLLFKQDTDIYKFLYRLYVHTLTKENSIKQDIITNNLYQ